MRKIVFCAAALAAASMMFGFDSAETADGLLQKMQEASNAENGCNIDMTMNVDAGISITSEGSETPSVINLSLKNDDTIAATIDPFAMAMNGNIQVSAMGTNQTLDMQMYMVTDENGKADMYLYQSDEATGESGWTHQQQELGFNIKELREVSKDFNYAEWGINWELDSAPADVNGTECYLLSTVIDADSLNTMLAKAEEMTGQSIDNDEQVSMVLSMLNGLKMKVEYYVDTTSYLPVKMHIDLNDTDLSAIDQYVAMAFGSMGEGSEIHLILNDFSIDADTAYGDVPEIVVPEEALATAVTDISESISEITG